MSPTPRSAPIGAAGGPADHGKREAAPDASVYLAHLAQLARELDAAASATAGVAALRRLRERLRQWVEDVRSVGHDALAAAVADLVQQLGAALAAPTFTDEVRAIAKAFEAIAAGGPLPPKSPGRPAFWK